MRILIAALIAVLVYLHYLLWIDEDGVRQTHILRITTRVQIEENAELAERNKGLEAEVKDLKNGLMAIEERARAEMGMIRPDETFYRLLEQPLPHDPLTSDKAAPSGKPATLAHKPPAAGKSHVSAAKSSGSSVKSTAKPATKPAKPPTKPKSAPVTPTLNHHE